VGNRTSAALEKGRGKTLKITEKISETAKGFIKKLFIKKTVNEN
jgi:hypothetical protein